MTLDSLEFPGRRRKSAAENVEALPIIASQIDKKAIGWAMNDMLARNSCSTPTQSHGYNRAGESNRMILSCFVSISVSGRLLTHGSGAAVPPAGCTEGPITRQNKKQEARRNKDHAYK